MPRHPMLVLLVDDDADDRQFFAEALYEIDPEIRFAASVDGIDALEFLLNATELPHYIFLDLNMPRMDGFQCLVELKKHTRFAQIPVIIYTTSRQQEEEKEAFRLGASAFFQKPSSFVDICRGLTEFIARIPNQI